MSGGDRGWGRALKDAPTRAWDCVGGKGRVSARISHRRVKRRREALVKELHGATVQTFVPILREGMGGG